MERPKAPTPEAIRRDRKRKGCGPHPEPGGLRAEEQTLGLGACSEFGTAVTAWA